MEVSPCSFDFFTFLMGAELCRRRRGLDEIHLFIIRGPNNNFRDDQIRDFEQNENFFLNVILPGLSLLPSIKKFFWMDRIDTTLDDIEPYFIYPRGYDLLDPVGDYVGGDLTSCRIRHEAPIYFSAPDYARKGAKQWLSRFNGKPVVTITARELDREDPLDKRKLNQEVWAIAISRMKEQGLEPVIIRDTATAFDGKKLFEDIEHCPEASLHLPFRLALYEQTHYNFSKSNGPGALQYFCSGNCSMLLEFDETNFHCKMWLDHFGMPKNGTFPMSQTNTNIIWNDESPERILSEIERVKNLEIAPNPISDINSLACSLAVAFRRLLNELKFGVVFPEDVTTINFIEQYRKANASLEIPAVMELIDEMEGKIIPKGVCNAILKLQKNA